MAVTNISSDAEHSIEIFNVPQMKNLLTLKGHTNNIYDMDWMPDNNNNNIKKKYLYPQLLITASADRTAILWTIEHLKYTAKVILIHALYI